MVFDIRYQHGVLKILDNNERKSIQLFVEDWEFTEKICVFRYSVDKIFSGRCKKFSFGAFLCFIRNAENYKIIREVVPSSQKFTLLKERYIIEINANIKIYAFVDSEIRVSPSSDRISIIFDEKRDIVFGVRSYHKKPLATIKITQDIEDIAKAVSLLSSSIKTKSCERSYPTLRGHPPLIEFSSEFLIPRNLKKFDSAVEIFIPKRFEYLYVVSPLSYYLIADIKFGKPKIMCENGFFYELPKFPRFEDEANFLLQKIFFFDCLVRCAGAYLNKIRELDVLKKIKLDIETLFEKSIEEQLRVYLSVPFRKIKNHMPRWHLSAYVEPVPERARALPFILNEMAAVFLPKFTQISQREAVKMALQDFFRQGNIFDAPKEKNIACPLLKNSQNHIWVSSEIPIGISKVEETSFLNQLRYHNRKKKRIEIALVLNDRNMSSEREKVAEIYKNKEDIEIEIFEFATKKELIDIFAKGFELVHFMGHCNKDGLLCSDGGLRTTNLKENNTPIFFLNACNSYEEGAGLITTGSVGGVVTLYRVLNKEALDVGYSFSRLLSSGFPLGKAIELARRRSIFWRDYLVLGNSEYSLIQDRNFISFFYEVNRNDTDFLLTIKSHVRGIGGVVHPYIWKNRDNHLLFNTPVFKLPYKDLKKAVELYALPVIYEDRLYWAEELFESNILQKRKLGS